MPPVIALLLYGLLAVVTGAALLVLANVFGPRRERRQKGQPYECGVPVLSTTRQAFHVRFYVVAVLFILFDVEIALLVPWATVYKHLGVVGFVEMLAFISVLGVGLVYAWRKGALEWD